MLKFRPKEDRIQAVRFRPEAPEGQKTQVIGSFPGDSKKIPRFILEKLDQNDLRELLAKVPLSTWRKGDAPAVKDEKKAAPDKTPPLAKLPVRAKPSSRK